MAVKIVRQDNRIALLGAPMSAAALAPGGEGAPSAFRKAGLIPRLQSIGYQVADLGDDPAQVYEIDEESPRARNLKRVLAALEALQPRVEIATKSGALPVILGGDASIALATVAGLRRYFRHVSMIYVDADAGLQTPATSPSGCVDGMVVSHLVGRGASEMVRFWSEPPLVREPDLALFGTSRFDPAEEQVLQTATLRRYFADDIRRKGAAKSATEAIDRIHGGKSDFVLHVDVDVFSNFQATNLPANMASSGGLRLEELREAFEVFAAQPRLAAIILSGYNPSRDTDGVGAQFVVDLLAEILATRWEKAKAAAAAASAPPVAKSAEAPVKTDAEPAPNSTVELPAVAEGEAWSSDMLEDESAAIDRSDSPDGNALGNAAAADLDDSDEPHS